MHSSYGLCIARFGYGAQDPRGVGFDVGLLAGEGAAEPEEPELVALAVALGQERGVPVGVGNAPDVPGTMPPWFSQPATARHDNPYATTMSRSHGKRVLTRVAFRAREVESWTTG